MSGLVERVRDSVRRSRSGRRKSTSRHGPRSSADLSDADSRTGRRSEDVNDGRAPTLPPTGAAWHVHKGLPASNGSSTPTSAVNDARSSTEGASSSARHHEAHRRTDSATLEQMPARTSSLRHPSQAETTDRLPQAMPSNPPSNGFPKRKQSLPQRKSLPPSADEVQERELHQQLSELSVESPRNGHRRAEETGPGRVIIGDDMVPPPLEPRRQEAAHPHHSEHLRVPAGFNLGSHETTSVDTQWRPAVTHEHIYPHRTEIIQEAITRDIHVHHYYTYLQPIRVVEVLPPRHFRIDEQTGQKVEIAAPAGWKLPHDMTPRPVDTSMVKASSRHYLVNEEHPHGIAEPPPVGYDDDVKRLLPINGHGRQTVQSAA